MHRLQLLWLSGSVVVAHGLSSCGLWALERRLSSCGAQALLLCGMWDLPGPGLEPVSLALAGGFLTTAPPGTPRNSISGYTPKRNESRITKRYLYTHAHSNIIQSSQNVEATKCPMMDEGINKMWYRRKMEHYSASKKE